MKWFKFKGICPDGAVSGVFSVGADTKEEAEGIIKNEFNFKSFWFID